MGLEKLEEQLLRQRQDFAPTDLIGVIAEVVKLKREDVARVLLANSLTQLFPPLLRAQLEEALACVSPDTETALEAALGRACKRAWAAGQLERGDPLIVYTKDLVGKEVARICKGCPDQLRCLADSLSTPEACVANHRHTSLVKVVSLKGDTVRVRAEQPRGEFNLSLQQIYWSLEYERNPFPPGGRK